jgi:uncharacterized membrane protein YedE/YeeE
MTPKFKDTINLPIAIPAWGLITMILGGVFTAGVTFQKLDQVIETSKKVDAIQERQIGGLAAIANLREVTQSHEARISNLERAMTVGKR